MSLTTITAVASRVSAGIVAAAMLVGLAAPASAATPVRPVANAAALSSDQGADAVDLMTNAVITTNGHPSAPLPAWVQTECGNNGEAAHMVPIGGDPHDPNNPPRYKFEGTPFLSARYDSCQNLVILRFGFGDDKCLTGHYNLLVKGEQIDVGGGCGTRKYTIPASKYGEEDIGVAVEECHRPPEIGFPSSTCTGWGPTVVIGVNKAAISQGQGSTAGSVKIQNKQTNKCLTVAGGVSTANSHPAVQFDCDTHPSRRWKMVSVGNGYQLRNAQTGRCLTIAGGVSTANSHPAVQFECDSHPSRRWKKINASGDSFQLQNAQTGKCLTIAGGVSTANSHPAVQFDCDTHPSRRWKLG